MSDRGYPEAVANEFSTPPTAFTDREGRTIEVRPYENTDEGYEALVEMYDAFDPADRAGDPAGRRKSASASGWTRSSATTAST